MSEIIIKQGVDIATLKEKTNNIVLTTDNIQKTLDDFIVKADDCFVSQKEFAPVRKIVYGAIGTIVTIVFASLIYLVVKV